MQSAQQIIDALALCPHPEGGYFRETFRDEEVNGRALSTAIYYLLEKGDRSHWHRVDATEIWHWYGGTPLQLSIQEGDDAIIDHTLGSDLAAGQFPQIIVPKHAWQSAVSLGDWTLVGCTVSPGFEFESFELAAPDWSPKR
ncbi:MAG: cupin domain-containing protein [Rickettsiales bacterium]|nr:cupin domain-containing protein [Rickettsiales bacterium]